MAAQWKKIIVSGSNISELANNVGYLVSGDNGVVLSGSFNGSFSGDGSGLTGVVAQGTISSSAQIASNISGAFTSTSASIAGTIANVSSSLKNSIKSVATGVGQLSGSIENRFEKVEASASLNAGQIATLQGKTLLSGSAQIASNISGAFASTANTLSGDISTLDSSVVKLTGNQSIAGVKTFLDNIIISGDLTVNGATTEVLTSNLVVEDKFILLNSGSIGNAEGGLIIDGGNGSGPAFVYDAQAERFAFTGSLASDASSVVPDAFVPAVVDLTAGHTDSAEYQKNGNIKIDNSGDVWIFA